jgi:hypothetical protein
MAINDINKLRLMNLFEGDKVGENRVQPPVFGAPTPPSDINAAQSYEDLFEPQSVSPPSQVSPDALQYTPETASIDAYQKHLGQTPTYQDPGIWDRLIAGGLTLGNRRRGIPGGIEQGQKFLEAPYDREMEAWKAKAVPLGNAATLENQRNVNSRNLAALELKERMDTRKQDETERKNQANEKIRQQNADIQAMKAANPNYEFNFTGPKVIVTRPGDPTPIVTNIDTGNVTEMTKLIAAQKRAETMAAGQLERAQIQAATSEAAGAQTQVETGTGLPVVINPRSKVPTQVPVKDATPIQKIPTNRAPGEAGPARGEDLARVQSMARETLSLLDSEIFDASTLDKKDANGKPIQPKLTGDVSSNVGKSRIPYAEYVLPYGSQAAGAAAIKRVKNRLTLNLIGEMKSQSRTGATGFGQLTGRELDLLEAAASKLDNLFLDEDTIVIPELMKIREKLQKILMPGDPSVPTVTPTGKRTPADMLRKYQGGQ